MKIEERKYRLNESFELLYWNGKKWKYKFCPKSSDPECGQPICSEDCPAFKILEGYNGTYTVSLHCFPQETSFQIEAEDDQP